MAMAAVPGQELGNHFYLNLQGLVYYSAPGTQWEGMFVPHIPQWLLPSTDPRSATVRYFFEGLPEGTPVPWKPWVLPLAIWTVYFFLVYALIALWGALLSRQWEEHERLLYPLTQVPLEMVGEVGTATRHLLLSPLMWGCFLLSSGLYLLRGLRAYFPSLPEINLQKRTEVVFPTGPLTVFNYMPTHIYPEMIGIAYLLSREVGFSFWFFAILRRLEQAGRIWWGIDTGHAEFFTLQTVGGYIVLALAFLYTARRYIKDTAMMAIFRRNADNERAILGSNPPASAELLIWGTVACFIAIWVWYRIIGISWMWGLLTLLGLLIASTVVARVVCEAGIFVYSSPFRINQAIFDIFGTDRIGARNTVLLTAVSWVQIRSTATMVMPYLMQGYKIGSVAELNRRQLLYAMVAAICISILVCHIAYPHVIYHNGVGKLGWWPSRS
ncbi:MAG TPA: hypothetical protein EYP10_14715, partial [Armatimonadetes bacterium]|nr:hypothetical protein [Armatimonadota bacterium]